MTIATLKEQNLILLECISGSKAYGTNLPHSDTDIKGVFYMPKAHFYGLDHTSQVTDSKNDIVYYELGRFIELLIKNNPNILELLAAPEETILYKHPIMDKILIGDVLSKMCKDTFGGYAFTQIRKAKGLNKKIVNPVGKERKCILHFCHILANEASLELVDYLEKNNLNQEDLGLVKVPHFSGTYAVFLDIDKQLNYQGIMQKASANEVRVSSVPKGEKPIAFLHFNKDGYTKYCKEYKAYWDWVEKRNEERYTTNVRHGRNYDSKNMMHTFRLLDMATEILRDEKIIVRRPDREQLLKIRAGEFDYEYLIEQANLKMEAIERAYEVSSLPDKPNTEQLKKTLLEMRMELYG